jgi:hypothetical protein
LIDFCLKRRKGRLSVEGKARFMRFEFKSVGVTQGKATKEANNSIASDR